VSNITPSGSGGAPLDIEIIGSSNPTIANVSIPLANTEVSYTLPANTKKFYIKLRDASAVLKLAYVMGDSGITYLTIPRSNWYGESELSVTGLTLYLQSSSPSQVAEVIIWT
jgi:hypothetical protein